MVNSEGWAYVHMDVQVLEHSDTGEHQQVAFGGGTLEVQEGVALVHDTLHSLVSILA